MAKKILKTKIVDNDQRKSAASGVIRGAVGTALLGPIGLVAGAVSAKNKKNTTFLIEYEDGSRDTKTVKTGSGEYKKLIKYIEM